jgi:hypothetical protein
MFFEMFSARLAHLHGYEFESFLFKSLDNCASLASLDTIRLDHDEGSLFSWDGSHLFRLSLVDIALMDGVSELVNGIF